MTRIMSTALGSRQPFKLITVSRHPEKATLMVKKIAEALDDRYIFIHAANCEHVDEVKFRVRDIQPDMLVWSSSWTEEQIQTICSISRTLKADVDLCGLPEDSPSQKSVDLISSRLKSMPVPPTQ